MEQSVKILGTRGSVPVSGNAFRRYGGATTCILVRMGGQFVVLDAGTGLLALPEEALRQPNLPLLLTHPHADHLLGLPMCPGLMRRGVRLDVYAAPRDGADARAQVERLVSPPLWPIAPEALPADIRFFDLPETMRLGEIEVTAIEGVHPGGVSLLRLETGGKRLVFATDCTLSEEFLPRAADFARGCDLLLCDGQYSDEEWPRCSKYGHSTWNMAARLARSCGAKRLRVVHHDPFRTDAELGRAAEALRAICPDYDFAKEGEEILL